MKTFCLNTAEAVDNVILSLETKTMTLKCLNTAEAVDNVIHTPSRNAVSNLSQYRRSSRQCNLVLTMTTDFTSMMSQYRRSSRQCNLV